MSKYSDLLAPPVSSPIPGRETVMVKNNAGGYTFSVSPRERLLRFLVLGADGATYYATKQDHFKQAYAGTEKAIQVLGKEAVDLIVDVSVKGRAPKQDAAIFALALCVARGSAEVRAPAIEAIQKVCRIPTHLFSFLTDVKSLGGKLGGRHLQRTLQNWYLDKKPEDLAYHLVKYRQRGGWTHRDVLRLAKPAGGNTPHGDLFAWATGKPVLLDNRSHMRIISAYEMAKDESLSDKGLASLVTQFSLPREALPEARLSGEQGVETWSALLHAEGGMPLTALLRTLNRMTAAGVFSSSEEVEFVCSRILSENLLRSARVHPIQVLSTLRTYAQGHGERGKLSWKPNPRIVAALEKAFLLSFGTVETSGKNFYVGLDVSGSMTMGDIAGVPGLTPREASSALALLWAKTEPSCIVKGFTANGGGYWNSSTALIDLTSDFKGGTLQGVQERVGNLPFGSTQPALIIEDALKNKISVDVFVVLTDNEVNSGDHPSKVLERYRREVNPNAKLVVVGMTATEFTLADPEAPYMLDMVGFDTAAPAAIQEFAK